LPTKARDFYFNMTTTQLVSFLNLFVVLNLILLFLFLAIRKNNATTNILLGTVILIPGFNFISNLFVEYHLITEYYIFYILQSVKFLWGPLLYFYVLMMLGKEIRFDWKFYTHFIPFIVELWFNIFLLLDKPRMYLFFDNMVNHNLPIYYHFTLAMLIQIVFYLVYLIVTIYRHSKAAQEFFSEGDKTKYQWLRELLTIMMIFDVITIILYIFIPQFQMDMIFIPLQYCLFYSFVVYKSLSYSAVFSKAQYIHYKQEIKPLLDYKVIKEKEEGLSIYGTLDYELIDKYYQTLLSYVEKENPYLNPDLTLKVLSDQVGIPVHYLSAVLNQKMGKSFFDCINSYRIEYVKQLLFQGLDKKYSLEAIGYEAGFNSKSAFYRAFKKYTNLTPTDYLKKHTIEETNSN
jgi:AraC-like DNA-binding protein